MTVVDRRAIAHLKCQTSLIVNKKYKRDRLCCRVGISQKSALFSALLYETLLYETLRERQAQGIALRVACFPKGTARLSDHRRSYPEL
ncbi:hypothetical protein [Nostoc sp.]|uniref:hypothetical protein n=1 Tax=Nostoc sp. TaxID=1180 RepID=UPI002FF8D00A